MQLDNKNLSACWNVVVSRILALAEKKSFPFEPGLLYLTQLRFPI
jgi:hypothetical protein